MRQSIGVDIPYSQPGEEVKRSVLPADDVVARVIASLGGPVVLLAQMNCNRQNESETDIPGFHEMLRSGWNPIGLPNFLARLKQYDKDKTMMEVMLSITHHLPNRTDAIRREPARTKMAMPYSKPNSQFNALKAP